MPERKQIQLDNLVIDTAQSRSEGWAGDEQDQQLVNSLERDGLLQSLIVRPVEMTEYAADVDEEYAIVAGSRRYRAAVEAGFDSTHCRVIEADDFEAAGKSLKENDERKDLTTQEKAKSIKLRYKLKEPKPPWECSSCGDTFEESSDLHSHIEMSSGCETPCFMKQGVPRKFDTKTQLINYLAAEHFNAADHDGRRKVKKFLEMAELPDEVLALWKPESKRTAQESETLSNFGIDRDLTAVRGGDVSRLGNQVLKLHRTVEEKVDSDSINTTNAVLETVGRLDQGQTDVDLQQEIKRFGADIEELESIDSDEQRKRQFREKLENHEMQVRERVEEIDGPNARLNFRLGSLADDHESVNKWHRYHARLQHEFKTESNAETVRQAYREYLEEKAEENGWN